MKFVVFEGLDGAGKSTLIEKIQQELKQRSVDFVLVRDPGSTPVGEKLRQVILDPYESPYEKTEVLMYEAARAELVEKCIRPALKNKSWVLSDRFFSSTIAFQAEARGLNRQDIDWLNNYACSGLVPDLTIYIDIGVGESQKRVGKRVGQTGIVKDRMEQENLDFHSRVRQGYLSQAQQLKSSWLVLDGMKSPEELFNEVVANLKERQWLV